MEKNNAPLLEMRNIKKGFFGNQVLTDINFTLEAGQVLGLVGENGAGYTNATTGVKSENVFLIYQDTYIMGNPGHYMGATQVEVPEKYFTLK